MLAHLTRTLRAGAKLTLVLKLNSRGRALLARKHRLTAQLILTEVVGAVKTPTTVLSESVTFGKAGRNKR